MASFQHLCMHCMQPIDPSNPRCPHCGYDNTQPQHAPYLPKGAVLAGRYLVGKVISLTADSTVYAGQDLQTMQTVQIREYLPEKLISRAEGESEVRVRMNCELVYQSGMGAFSTLWQTLQKNATHAALPQVYAVLFLNATVYAVTAALECISLAEYMRQPEHVLSWHDCCIAFKPIFRALAALHAQGILHLAISSSCVYVGADGRLHLGGFTIPQTKTDLAAFHTAPVPHFAPMELQNGTSLPDPVSDVYAIMAVFFLCLTGTVPPDASDRLLSDDLAIPVDVARTLPPDAIETLYAALQLYPQRRLPTMDALLERLYPQEFISAPVKPDADVEPKTEAQDDYELAPEDEELLFDLDGEPGQKKEASAGLLGLEAFLAILVIGTMLFCTLYSTFLYQRMEIPLLDSILAPLTFLPLNSDDDTTVPSTRPTAETDENEPTKEMVTVPNCLVLTYSDLTTNLTFPRNFDFRIEFESSETVRKNAVISQNLTPNTTVPKGTTLIVTVSSGKPLVELRDVVGYNYIDAYEMLTKDGFQVEKIMLKNDGTHEVGEVYTMSLVAGLSFEKGTTVSLSVWDATGLTQKNSN